MNLQGKERDKTDVFNKKRFKRGFFVKITGFFVITIQLIDSFLTIVCMRSILFYKVVCIRTNDCSYGISMRIQ